MWQPFKKGFKAVKATFKRRLFRRDRVDAINTRGNMGSVATSVDRCNRCGCPYSCTCYCHTATRNIPSPPLLLPQNISQNPVSPADSTEEGVDRELAEADDRFVDAPRPCSPTSPSIPPVPSQDHETIQLPQQSDVILFGTPRPPSGLSYVTVEVQQHPPECQDEGRLESAYAYASDTLPTSTILSPHAYCSWGVVPLPSVDSSPHSRMQTPVEDGPAPTGAQSPGITTHRLAGTSRTTNRLSVMTAATVVVSLIEATEDLLNFPETGEVIPNELFGPVLSTDVPTPSSSYVVNRRRSLSDRVLPPNVQLPTRFSAGLEIYTNSDRARLEPLELPREAPSGPQAQDPSIGVGDVSGYVQVASPAGLYAASHSEGFDASEQVTTELTHLIGHSLLNELSEPGGFSTPGSQPIGRYTLDFTSTIRDIMVLEVRRLHSHLYSVIDRYICRVMEGTPLDWSVGRRPQRQTIIGLMNLQHLIEEIRDHALNANGAQVFAILEILSMFEGDLSLLTTQLDRSQSGSDANLSFTLSCLDLPEGLNKLYRGYENRFLSILTFFIS